MPTYLFSESAWHSYCFRRMSTSAIGFTEGGVVGTFKYRDIFGSKIRAIDKDVGKVTDIYFEGRSFSIKYLVVDARIWLVGKQVLLPPETVRAVLRSDRVVVDLTAKEVKSSPELESHRPVSQQYEAVLRKHFGWPIYWFGVDTLGTGYYGYPYYPTPVHYSGFLSRGRMSDVASVWESLEKERKEQFSEEDLGLRSCKEVTGYTIVAPEGELGKIGDFVCTGQPWQIPYLVVTDHRSPKKYEFLIPTQNVSDISWEHRLVTVSTSKDNTADVGNLTTKSA